VTLPDAEAIFLSLADVDPAERPRALEERCGGDDRLRRNVEHLLSTLDAPDDDFLDPAHVPTLDMNAVDGPLQPGTRLGEFLVLHAIGSGGMGVVYAAQQERPRRTVAIKVLRRGFRHPDILRRFEHEAETLGRLQHPGIAQVYTFAGGDRTTPAHLVMELVAGPPLTDYVRAAQLPVRDRVALVVEIADAIQHAHERGVIHRDLKPANILVAGGGQPKVLDFGIARATGTDLDRVTVQTAHGQLMGTIAYMSPEQLRGRPAEVDGRADVYALGVVLYRVLTDRMPFDLAGLPWPEAVQRVLTARPLPIGEIDAALAGGLDHVVAKAMARDANVRYPSAAAFQNDLQGWLDGRGVETSRFELHAVVEDRKPMQPAAPLTVVLPLPTGGPTLSRSTSGNAICVVMRSGELIARSASDGATLWSVTCGDVRALAVSPAGPIAAGLSDGAIEIIDSASGRQRAVIHAHTAPVVSLAFSGDGSQLVSAGADGAVRLWNAIDAVLIATVTVRAGAVAALQPVPGRVVVAWDDGLVEAVAPTHG
jgi:tRNA A-37 threonylcarbamoyl transferase component Bud32